MGLQVLWELYPVEDSPVDRCKDLLLSGRLVGDAAYVKGRSHVDTFAVKFLSGIVYTVYLSWSYVVFCSIYIRQVFLEPSAVCRLHYGYY